jgi:quercetin dioxygenase-like cupin family protein
LTLVDAIGDITSKSQNGKSLSAYTNLNQNLTYFIAKKLESLSLKLNSGKLIPSFAVQPDQGDRFQVLAVANSQRLIKVRGSQTNGRLMIMEGEILVGEGPPIHIHHREDEYFHVLKGEIEFKIGDQKIIGREGTWVYAPRYIKHRYRNVNSMGARLEFVFQPAGIEDYFEEVSRVIVAQQPDWEDQAAAVAKKYHIELLGTPDWTG